MISVESISIDRDGRKVIENFSLEIGRGAIVALVGPNGSGKSTVLHAISGDLPMVSGGIFFDGLPVQNLSIPNLALLRAVAQQSQRYTLAYSVGEIIGMAVEKSGDEDSILEAIEALDILPLMSRKITSLSGGEQQRVSIALALSQSTPYLLLDEPFAAQDVASTERIVMHLKKLTARKVGILVVAHMLESELKWCDSLKRLELAQS